MTIEQQTKLTDIQNAFSKQFPHLRLEFYKSKHGAGEGSTNQEKLDADQLVSEIAEKALGQHLTFDDALQVSEFEGLLLKKYGLSAQVFRRSGDLWLQTTTTDKWTLEEANRKGGHSRELFKESD